MSSVQHKPFDFIGIPTDLSIALIGIPPSKDAETAKFAASRFQKIADDYQAWELAARKLHVDVDDPASDGIIMQS